MTTISKTSEAAKKMYRFEERNWVLPLSKSTSGLHVVKGNEAVSTSW
jgi:hypothetical protein